MIDEAMQYAIDFCHEDQSPEEMIRRGEIVVQSIRGRLVEIDDKNENTTFILGGVLKKLKENNLWKNIPGVQSRWTLGDFCIEMIGRSLGTCYSKIRIWEKSQEVGMTPAEVVQLGSIADHILREANNREDVDRLIELYREVGSRDRFLQELKKKDEEKPPEERSRKRYYLRLNATEGQFYEGSLEKAAEAMKRELHKNCSPEEALIFALVQWQEMVN